MSDSWVPRALKKRSSEFTTTAAERPAAELPVAAIGPSSSISAAPAASSSAVVADFKGAQDLEDLEDDEGEPSSTAPPPPKRTKLDTCDTDGRSSEVASAPPKPNGPPRDEIIDGAPRLAAHITSAAKFNKVATMSFALLDGGRVTRSNAAAFFAVLDAGMLEPRRLRDRQYRVAFRKLYGAAILRASLFPESVQARLKLWEVQVIAQADLHTDDTFQFTRAAKQVREALHGLPCIYPALEPEGAKHVPEAERGAWADALFDCVGSAMGHFMYPWAKSTYAAPLFVASERCRRRRCCHGA
jgi:hypothetical protein